MWSYNYTVPQNDLYHHGIRGMKWGVRRYQNKDGSLTSVGRKRRSREDLSSMSDQELKSKVERLKLEKRYSDVSRGRSGSESTTGKIAGIGKSATSTTRDISKISGKNTSKMDAVNKGFDVISKGQKAADSIKKVSGKKRVDLSNMSDAELREKVNRMDFENQYRNLKSERISRGRVTANDILDVAGSTLSVTASAAALALSIYQIKKQMG